MTRKEEIQVAYGFPGGKKHTFYDGTITRRARGGSCGSCAGCAGCQGGCK